MTTVGAPAGLFNRQRRRNFISALLGSVVAAAGCATTGTWYEPQLSTSQDRAGSAHVAVLSIAPWECAPVMPRFADGVDAAAALDGRQSLKTTHSPGATAAIQKVQPATVKLMRVL